MLNKLFSGKKLAGITIEVTLSIALSLVVMFLMFGLFSDNLQTMAANSGLFKFFFRQNNEIAKTAQTKWKTDPTKTVVTVYAPKSQTNVEVIADQGLELKKYYDNVQNSINELINKPVLTPAEQMNLAKYITQKQVMNYLGSQNYSPVSTVEAGACYRLGVIVPENLDRGITRINVNGSGTKSVIWNGNIKLVDILNNQKVNEQINVLNRIGTAFDNFH